MAKTMDIQDFEKRLQLTAQKLRNGGGQELALRVEALGMQFVDDNFQNQVWEGVPWKKRAGDTDPGRALLVKTGSLRDGFRSYIEPGQVRFVNRVRYAKLHNEGFRGVVYVRPHKRTRTVKAGKGTKVISKRYNVKGYGKRMNMPRRQFAPYAGSHSPTLMRKHQETIEGYIREVFDSF